MDHIDHFIWHFDNESISGDTCFCFNKMLKVNKNWKGDKILLHSQISNIRYIISNKSDRYTYIFNLLLIT